MRAVEARGRDRGNYGSAGARDDRRLLLFLARRLAWAAVVVLAIAVIDFALIRVLQPQLDPAHGVGDEVVNDLGRAFLHPQRGRWRRSPRSRASWSS